MIPQTPTLEDLNREAILGTISMIPMIVLVVALSPLLIEIVSDSFASGLLLGTAGTLIYLAMDRYIEEILVDRGLISERRDPYESTGGTG